MFADSAREALAELGVAEVLTFQLKRAPDGERRHVILEILGALGESGKSSRLLQEEGLENIDLIFLSRTISKPLKEGFNKVRLYHEPSELGCVSQAVVGNTTNQSVITLIVLTGQSAVVLELCYCQIPPLMRLVPQNRHTDFKIIFPSAALAWLLILVKGCVFYNVRVSIIR